MKVSYAVHKYDGGIVVIGMKLSQNVDINTRDYTYLRPRSIHEHFKLLLAQCFVLRVVSENWLWRGYPTGLEHKNECK